MLGDSEWELLPIVGGYQTGAPNYYITDSESELEQSFRGSRKLYHRRDTDGDIGSERLVDYGALDVSGSEITDGNINGVRVNV